jgi:flavin reductase (DIM6/NTAB) family NADH-FMN oxidoreductase RutF
MKKVEINNHPLICVQPIVLVGAIVDGKPNFMAASWCGVANGNPPMVSVAIRPSRYTLNGVKTGEFSINIPSVDIVKETDYCGIVSGKNTDKIDICKFNVFYGKSKNAPLIEQCPVNLVLKVEHVLELGSHNLIVGSIQETLVNEDDLTNGKPDISKINPIVYTSGEQRGYFTVGQPLGEAFKVGKEIGQ